MQTDARDATKLSHKTQTEKQEHDVRVLAEIKN